MPHVLALVVAGAGIYAGLKFLARLGREAAAQARSGDAAAPGGRAAKDLGQLDRDPSTGVYRPRAK